MKSLLFRTGSGKIPLQVPPSHGSPRLSTTVPVESSPLISLPRRSIRRSASEPNVMIRSDMRTLSKLGSRSFSMARIPRVEFEDCNGDALADWAVNGITWEEVGFPGGGMNKNRKPGGSGKWGNGNNAERNNIRDYYHEMIKTNPTNSLLLRNYGRYLHEVEGDVVKAEEYYGRAILACPGDGELLSLYGKLIWETQRDESRAKSYFTQALQASPHNCMVLGSYAHFLWELEEEEEECGEDEEMETKLPTPKMMMEAF